MGPEPDSRRTPARWVRRSRLALGFTLAGATLVLLPDLVLAIPFEIQIWLARLWGPVIVIVAAVIVTARPARLPVVAILRRCSARRNGSAAPALQTGLRSALAELAAGHPATFGRWAPPDGWARLESLADRALRGRLASVVAAACLLMLGTWIPHYLTWPLWSDLDQFAVSARAWEAGILPYRDLPDFDFPGPIYLFWILGKTAGWGRTAPLFAVDAALVVLLGGALLAWSRRLFGRALPGLAAYATFLGYYLGLDYAQVAQRDWHGPLCAALGLLALQAWSGRAGRMASALLTAAAMAIRPQAVLFLPAILSAIDEGARSPGSPRAKTIQALAEWCAAFGASLVVIFAPLICAGVMRDFLRVLRVAHYGGSYNKVTFIGFGRGLGMEVVAWNTAWVLAAIVSITVVAPEAMRRSGRTWALALLGVLFYKPLSPFGHVYLNHPRILVGSIAVAVVVGWLLSTPRLSPMSRLLAVVAVLIAGTPGVPLYCSVTKSVQSLGPLARGEDPVDVPLGCKPYFSRSFGREAPYRWADYRQVLAYLRRTTQPETLVANVLNVFPYPPLNGPAGRLSPFPAAGGILYLPWVNPGLEAEFAATLDRSPDSVVVWIPSDPGVDPKFRFGRIMEVVRGQYQPEVRFGAIEVWRRKPGPRPSGRADP
jgi:hypothetical protein